MSKALTGKSKVYYMIKKLSRTLLIICMSFVIFAVGILGWIIIVYKRDKTESELTHQQDFISNHRFYDIDEYYGSNEININIRKLHEIPFFKSDDSAIRHRNTEHGTPRCLALELNVKKSIDENRLCKLDSDC